MNYLLAVHLLALVSLITTSASCRENVECCSLTDTNGCDRIANPLEIGSVTMTATCINKTHISFSWAVNVEIVSLNLEYTCYNTTDNETEVFVFKSTVQNRKEILPLFEGAEYSSCTIRGCARKGFDYCGFADLLDSYTISSCSTDVISTHTVPHTHSSLISSSLSETLDLPTGTIPRSSLITKSLTSTSSIYSKPQSLSSTVMLTTSATSATPTAHTGAEATTIASESFVISVAVGVSIVILGVLCSLTLCISCLAYKKRGSDDIYYYSSDKSIQTTLQELQDERYHFDLILDEPNFKGSVLTIVQELEYDSKSLNEDQMIYEHSYMRDCHCHNDPMKDQCSSDQIAKEFITYSTANHETVNCLVRPESPSYLPPSCHKLAMTTIHHNSKSKLNQSLADCSTVQKLQTGHHLKEFLLSSESLTDNNSLLNQIMSEGDELTDNSTDLYSPHIHVDTRQFEVEPCYYSSSAANDTSCCSEMSSGDYITTCIVTEQEKISKGTNTKWLQSHEDGYIHA